MEICLARNLEDLRKRMYCCRDKKPNLYRSIGTDRTHVPTLLSEDFVFKLIRPTTGCWAFFTRTMSISIDELTNSFSASHVGQEAMDLAALQAQLAQTLFGQSIAQSSRPQMVSRKTSFTQPCNTPTYTNFSHFSEPQSATTGPSSWSFDSSRDDMEEDERMVEDLLVPRSPTASTLQYSLSSWSKTHYTTNSQTSETSSFTTTDPFYLAQFQAQHQKATSPYSAFSELGKLPQQSSFQCASSPRREHHNSNASAPALALETHSFFVAASAAH
ncbi:hypothetical protein DXG01_013190 [Tephrocybe rancida]|nr:hypothetical protein DXG01_013190 [Tephrocybe rancida]